MLTVLTWLWQPHNKYRSQYTPLHVELMRQRVAEHCTLPHEFVCVTDRPAKDFAPGTRVVPLWDDHKTLPPAFHAGPSCYRRLRAFAADAHRLLGLPARSTVASIDLDSVPCGARDSLDALWNLDEDFVGWRASDRAPTCGSMFLLRLGSLPRVWTEFEYNLALRESKRTGYVGTDQAWMARMLAKSHGSWSALDGVYSFKMHCLDGLPPDARVVFFHGKPDPWDADVRRDHPWIRAHYPLPGELPTVERMIAQLGESGINCHG